MSETNSSLGNNQNSEDQVFISAPETFSGFCPISPVPKGRPRFARKGKFVQTYTPKETLEYESSVRSWMRKKYGMFTLPMDGNIKARYEFVMPRPKSCAKKTLVNTKPDVDNLVKSFQDALDFKDKSHGKQLGVLANDSRVTSISATKRYAIGDEPCGTFFSFVRDGDIAVIFFNERASKARVTIDPSIQAFVLDELENMAGDGVRMRDISKVFLFTCGHTLDGFDKRHVGAIATTVFPNVESIVTM